MTNKEQHVPPAQGGTEKAAPQHDFNGLGIAPAILDVLAKAGFSNPTPIQHKSIPIAISGKDMVGIAQTGTGKTLAFGLPMIQKLLNDPSKRGLVIVPTRELALQVDENLQKIGRSLGFRTAVLIGGDSMYRQIQAIRRIPHLVIATPGRLVDHLQQKTIALNNVGVIVLDEADRMLDMGFAPQITKILNMLPKERQTMLFSATMPQAIFDMASRYMALPIRIEVAPAGTSAERVDQEIIVVKKEARFDLLQKLLAEYKGSVLLFSRTKHGARKITKALYDIGHKAAEIHSNRSLSQRKEALEGFKLGRYRILVATDIAARGIDVKGIEVVINFDLPDNHEDYVHRIGRTGRAGREGKAISFATPDQGSDIRGIEQLIRKKLTTTSHAGATLDSRGSAGRGAPRRGGFQRGPFQKRSRFQGASRQRFERR